MSFKMDRIHVWAVEVKDQIGGAAQKLSALAEAGTNLEFIETRRNAEKPGTGTLFVGPITSANAKQAAHAVGMQEVDSPIVMHIVGDNTAGLAFRLKHKWAKAGISLHGAVLSVIDKKFVGYVSFDSSDDANRAASILAEEGTVQA